MPLTPEQNRQVEELFTELSDRPVEERDTLIAAIQDDAVRTEVKSLLAHISNDPIAGSFDLAVGQIVQAATEAGAFHTIGPGSRFGHYKIESRLGLGGMGEVYEAVRLDDFHKRVALKIVRHGLDSEYARRRFAQERQVLAGLEHPNIARLLDGGTEGELPYLVLEYVDGIPIDHYCAGRSRNEILRLFLKVCEAVDYAHRNLIIHRDLKPANILVTADGEPKLLDFGIAKLLDVDNVNVTQTAFASLTPQYASPEQIRNEMITTASDVYALGTILYELLTGRKPYTLTTTSLVELDRLICQTEPPKPDVSEDLDNIILMAIRKDANRRYATVREFADDIERSLTDRPVRARPDSLGYRAGKFIRRNKVALAGAVLVAVALAGGIVVSQYQANRAARRFEQVRRLANKFLFDFDNAIAPVAGTTKARELVVSTALEYLENLAGDAKGDPDLEAELAAAFEKLGDVQGSPSAPSLGRPDDALRSYYRSRALWEPVVAARPKDAKSLKSFAAVTLKSGDIELRTNKKKEAAQSFERGSLLAERALAADPANPDLAYLVGGAWYRRGERARDEEDSTRAIEAFNKSLDRYKDLVKTSPTPRYFNALGMAEGRIGHVYLEVNRPDEARPYLERAVETRRRLVAENPNTVAFRRSLSIAITNLANPLGVPATTNLGDLDGAEKLLRESLAIQESIAEKDPADRVIREDLLITRFQLAEVMLLKDPQAALQLCAAARAGVNENQATASRTDLQIYLRQNVAFIEASALAKLRKYPAALAKLDEVDKESEQELSKLRRTTLRVEILGRTGHAAEAVRLSKTVLAPFETGKLADAGLRQLREAAHLYEVVSEFAPRGDCQLQKKEQAIWREWQNRKQSPQWYARKRLPVLQASCLSGN